jgi:hypothetical protein
VKCVLIIYILQDFKCHKFVLALASEIFERMFFGVFKDVKLDPNQPILLNKIDPEVFECALR